MKNRATGEGKSDLGKLVARDKKAHQSGLSGGSRATTEQRVNKWLLESEVASTLME